MQKEKLQNLNIQKVQRSVRMIQRDKAILMAITMWKLLLIHNAKELDLGGTEW